MQPTLRLRTVIPSNLARFRAMRTSDAEVPFHLKGMKRQKMIFNVGLTLFPADVKQGIEFQYAAALLKNGEHHFRVLEDSIDLGDSLFGPEPSEFFVEFGKVELFRWIGHFITRECKIVTNITIFRN